MKSFLVIFCKNVEINVGVQLTYGKILRAGKSMLGLSVMCHRESQEGTFVTAACVGKVLDVVVCYASW